MSEHSAQFYLGVHGTSQRWWDAAVPLCVSRNRMPKRKVPQARAPWILDSGAFTELRRHGRYTFTAEQYADDVQRFALPGHLQWVAPMDWMCEPFMLDRTGLSVDQHIGRTVDNYIELEEPVTTGAGIRTSFCDFWTNPK